MVQSTCNPCVIMDMELESSCFGMEGSKMEGGLMKILGRATLIESIFYFTFIGKDQKKNASYEGWGGGPNRKKSLSVKISLKIIVHNQWSKTERQRSLPPSPKKYILHGDGGEKIMRAYSPIPS